MAEDPLVGIALAAAQSFLQPPLIIKRGAPLLYAVTVNNSLAVTVDPKKPVRGQAAFETDLCVFENKGNGVEIPRVVMEFKARITTHDVITYSAKARRHKQVYPYLRYGIVIAAERTIPGRVFVHNGGARIRTGVPGVGPEGFSVTLGEIIDREALGRVGRDIGRFRRLHLLEPPKLCEFSGPMAVLP